MDTKARNVRFQDDPATQTAQNAGGGDRDLKNTRFWPENEIPITPTGSDAADTSHRLPIPSAFITGCMRGLRCDDDLVFAVDATTPHSSKYFPYTKVLATVSGTGATLRRATR